MPTTKRQVWEFLEAVGNYQVWIFGLCRTHQAHVPAPQVAIPHLYGVGSNNKLSTLLNKPHVRTNPDTPRHHQPIPLVCGQKARQSQGGINTDLGTLAKTCGLPLKETRAHRFWVAYVSLGHHSHCNPGKGG